MNKKKNLKLLNIFFVLSYSHDARNLTSKLNFKYPALNALLYV